MFKESVPSPQPHSICEHFFNFQSIYLDYVYEDVCGAGRQPGLSCTHSPSCLLGPQGEGLLVLSSASLASLSELGDECRGWRPSRFGSYLWTLVLGSR